MISELRFADLNDIPVIRAIAHSAWPVAYHDIISQEQISYMLELMYSPDSLTGQMQERGHRFLLASQNSKEIGFASVGREDERTFKLHKLYVLPEVKGTGIGKILLHRAMDEAKSQGAETLILQVNRCNPSVQFYQKNGFSVREETVLHIGQGYVMDDYIMQISLL